MMVSFFTFWKPLSNSKAYDNFGSFKICELAGKANRYFISLLLSNP